MCESGGQSQNCKKKDRWLRVSRMQSHCWVSGDGRFKARQDGRGEQKLARSGGGGREGGSLVIIRQLQYFKVTIDWSSLVL